MAPQERLAANLKWAGWWSPHHPSFRDRRTATMDEHDQGV